MSGWDLQFGNIKEYNVSEDKIWSLFNFEFNDFKGKRNTYKYGLIKSLLDNVFNGSINERGVFLTYEQIFDKFAENYWNLVVKYDLHQMRPSTNSTLSKVEQILKKAASIYMVMQSIPFDSIDEEFRGKIVKEVTKECKKYVVGALYNDFEGIIYSFDLKDSGITLNHCIYEFILKYKLELEKLNYYAWAKFLEQINDDSALVRVIDKLELATPKRGNLSVYRELLRREFEENTCFYCGKKLQNKIHVDHFIPWDFVKDDKMWNFVLSCSTCNERKNNRVPKEKLIIRIEERNKRIQLFDDILIRNDFENYSDDLIRRMWAYAKMGGIKVFEP